MKPYASPLSILILEAKPQISKLISSPSYGALEEIAQLLKSTELALIRITVRLLIARYLPGALANLQAKKYSAVIANLQDVVGASGDCENQFAGCCPLPVSQRNKAVHDIADMTTDIIKTFV
ncbi:hypothetical protein DY000_02042664 [Brassica cretica]|uniref:Pectinesterase inhibitor domain-containing protein n=1 Tax=Brassica cretica TaxID=69181 RepID=A0ABQ7BQA7_BRACR|nr:hypothetical protein DY000_02042664 [Brassica cretica]